MRTPQDWIVSDTHFGHKNIVNPAKGCFCRPGFANIAEHDDRLICEWNRVVMQEDTVFHLGDVGMTVSGEALTRILRQLNGIKILVAGNHDHWKSLRWWMSNGRFQFAAEKILYRGAWLTHIPAQELPAGAYINLHGHLHNTGHRDAESGGKKPFQKLFALENENYAPVSWDQWVPKPDLKAQIAIGV